MEEEGERWKRINGGGGGEAGRPWKKEGGSKTILEDFTRKENGIGKNEESEEHIRIIRF